jgi:rhamnose utilization protein RhaD (predicted bifunctional aldolase and dehydrogenase)
MDPNTILKDLITLSHELGLESRQLAILGEGNTSARCEDGTFWVKASGSQLGNIDEHGFSRVSFEAMTALIQRGPLTDQQIEDGLMEVLVDKTHRKPSVETDRKSVV